MDATSDRSKFFEELNEAVRTRRTVGDTMSRKSTMSDFDRRIVLVRRGIAEARDVVSRSSPALVDLSVECIGGGGRCGIGLRSCEWMRIDGGCSLCPSRPIPGPLPHPHVHHQHHDDQGRSKSKRSIGTNTDPCLVIPCPPFSSSPLPWRKFQSPTFTLTFTRVPNQTYQTNKEKRGFDEEQEEGKVTQRIHLRTQEKFNHPIISKPTPPITFSKLLESDIQISDSGEDWSEEEEEDGEDGDDGDDEGTCCGDRENWKVLSWTSSLNHLDSPLTSSTSTLGGSTHHHPTPPSPPPPLLTFSGATRTQSMMNLGGVGHPNPTTITTNNEERTRSMEILLQDSKHPHPLRAPENTLMMRGTENRQPSEHELRIQKSLGKLDVPDWYRKYSGTLTRDSPSSPTTKELGKSGHGLAGGWSGLSSSKTSSLTSLNSTGRYTGGGRLSSSRLLGTGTNSAGGRCGESVRSPNSTASVSPTPYYERSSFTYGLPYAMSRFGSARMSCGASPASLSPSPSPVGCGLGSGTATSTPTASGPSTRHNSFSKQPYLGWRSQERLASKSLYKSPSERLAADLLKTQTGKSGTMRALGQTSGSGTESEKSSLGNLATSPRKETASSDLSLNNSEESNSHKLNRVRSSIKEVSNAIVDYVNETRPLDDGLNGRASPRRGFLWLESSFVGTKPIDSPTTPDTPTLILIPRKEGKRTEPPKSTQAHPIQTHHQQPQQEQSGVSRNDQISAEERISSSSSVSSPTLDDILDSLLALRRPQTQFKQKRDKGLGGCLPPSGSSPSVVPGGGGWPSSRTPGGPSPGSSSPARVIGRIESSFLTNPSATVGIGMGLISPSPSPSHPVNESNQVHDKDKDILTTMSSEAWKVGGDDEFDPDFLLTIPTDPKRAFNISPETNLGPEAEEEELGHSKGNSFTRQPIATTPHPLGRGHLVTESQLQDSSLPSSPAKHRRVSFDLDLEEKEDKSSSRSRKDSDSTGGSVILCRNSKCGKSGVGLEARREFKTCHNCNAYYCSRDCRRAHWDKHKKVCMQSRVGALCKQIIAQVRDDPDIVSHLSRLSRQGYLAKGRGCIKLFFSSPDRAERFLTGGFPDLPQPWYIGSGDILPEEMGGSVFGELSEQCQSYNTENRFVLYVSLCVVNEVPTSGAVKWEREMIARSAKVRLVLARGVEEESPHHQVAPLLHHFIPPEPPGGGSHHFLMDNPIPLMMDPNHPTHPHDPNEEEETIILQSVPIPTTRQLSPTEERRMREVSFGNIQRHLRERGIELGLTYPDIYSRLRAYVEREEHFLPVTIHPRNRITGKIFRVILMPDWKETQDPITEYTTTSHRGTDRIIDISSPPPPPPPPSTPKNQTEKQEID